MIGSALSYLFQIISGRMLTVTDYGSLTVLFSIIAIATVPSNTVSMFVSRNATIYKYNSSEKWMGVLKKILLYITVVSAFIAIIGIAVSPFISGKLDISNNIYLVYTFIIIGLGLMLAIVIGVFQGYKRFVLLGVVGLVLPIVKMLSLLTIYLAKNNQKIDMVLIFIIAGDALLLFGGLFYIYRKCNSDQRLGINNDSFQIYTVADNNFKTTLKYIISAGIAGLCLALITNIDSIIVKRYFTGEEAGLYSSAMMFGRILLYIPNALVLVMFPLITEATIKNISSRKILLKTLIYSSILIFGAFFFFLLFSNNLITLLYGTKYTGAVKYILWSMINIIPVSFIAIITNYCLAKNEIKFFLISIVATAFCDILSVSLRHDDINSMLLIMSILNFACFIANYIYIYANDKQKQREGALNA